MIRFLLNTLVFFLASAIGLVVATWVLPDMTMSASGFLVAVLIFAVVQAVLSPFLLKVTARGMSAVVGAVGLIATLVALIITTAVSDSLQISGAGTWVLAALIIWLVGMLAALLLPLLLVKRVIDDNGNRRRR